MLGDWWNHGGSFVIKSSLCGPGCQSTVAVLLCLVEVYASNKITKKWKPEFVPFLTWEEGQSVTKVKLLYSLCDSRPNALLKGDQRMPAGCGIFYGCYHNI